MFLGFGILGLAEILNTHLSGVFKVLLSDSGFELYNLFGILFTTFFYWFSFFYCSQTYGLSFSFVCLLLLIIPLVSKYNLTVIMLLGGSYYITRSSYVN